MEPLQEIRDKLIEFRQPEFREEIRRNKTEGTGPTKPEYRYELLKRLLEAQKQIQEHDSSILLISNQELVAIQVIWYRDNIFRYSVAELYNKIYLKEIDMSKVNNNLQKEMDLLRKSCENNENDFNLIGDLLRVQQTKNLLSRKRGLLMDLNNAIDAYMKSLAV
jgi:DNA sulfur modification protein DndC